MAKVNPKIKPIVQAINPVAKHSRNKSGAGAHKSAKDYDRKDKRADILSRMDEGEERSIIQQACIPKLIDNFSWQRIQL